MQPVNQPMNPAPQQERSFFCRWCKRNVRVISGAALLGPSFLGFTAPIPFYLRTGLVALSHFVAGSLCFSHYFRSDAQQLIIGATTATVSNIAFNYIAQNSNKDPNVAGAVFTSLIFISPLLGIYIAYNNAPVRENR